VVVSAKKVASTVTVSVPTGDKGRFSFPASRLEPGQYGLSIRAIGYDLEGRAAPTLRRERPRASRSSLRRPRTCQADVERRMVRELPGTDQDKEGAAQLCELPTTSTASCARNTTASSSSDIFNRMVGYYPGSTPEHPQRLVGKRAAHIGPRAQHAGGPRSISPQ